MRTLITVLALFGMAVVASAGTSREAEATTRRFAEALAQFDVVPMVDEFHSDVHRFCYQMAVHIIETTEDKTERADLLKALGVTSADQFKELSPKTATARFFKMSFSSVPKQVKDASTHSKIIIVGSLIEKDYVHVLYRSEMDFKDNDLSMSMSVPSVVTLKRDNGNLKVASTTQLETMKATLKSLTETK
jgi:hypothetical protein